MAPNSGGVKRKSGDWGREARMTGRPPGSRVTESAWSRLPACSASASELKTFSFQLTITDEAHTNRDLGTTLWLFLKLHVQIEKLEIPGQESDRTIARSCTFLCPFSFPLISHPPFLFTYGPR